MGSEVGSEIGLRNWTWALNLDVGMGSEIGRYEIEN